MDKEEIFARARLLLRNSERPVFVFDDDCDGLASFLLLYHFCGKGTPMVIKSSPNLTSRFAATINSFDPDIVVILDIALVQDDALEMINCEVLWIDHHEPQEPRNALYINPQLYGEDHPTSLIAYDIVNDNSWLCAAGCISDYYYPTIIIDELRENNPELIGSAMTIDDIHYNSRLGKIIDILGFSMKGTVRDALSLIKILMNARSPYDLLDGNPAFMKVIRHYERVKKKYDELKKDALDSFSKDNDLLKIFLYDSEGWSLTHELSSELASYYPDSIIIVGRPYNGRLLLSLRSRTVEIKDNLEKTMASFDGTGGGHVHACGANILRDDTERFIESFRDSFL
jgi:single-stranded DNA-specific DHH superfamily exonuclease